MHGDYRTIATKQSMVNGGIKEGILKYLETNENVSTVIQKSMGCRSIPNREVYSNTSLPQETKNMK